MSELGIGVVEVFVFRHGETDWNRERRLQGSTDIHLNDQGRVQAQELALRLQTTNISAILSSDLTRAQQTAQTVLKEVVNFRAARAFASDAIQFVLDARLRETALGDVEGKTFDEVHQQFGPAMIARWHSMEPQDADFRFPGGESKGEVRLRAMLAMEEFLLQNHSLSCIAVSSHGGVIRRILHAIVPDLPNAVMVPNCAVFALHFDRRKRQWHLQEGGWGSDLIHAARAGGPI